MAATLLLWRRAAVGRPPRLPQLRHRPPPPPAGWAAAAGPGRGERGARPPPSSSSRGGGRGAAGGAYPGFPGSAAAQTPAPPARDGGGVLVANRGEIAARVARTARALGLEAVGVFSEADRHALHVRGMDRAVFLGPAPAAESYLVIDKVVAAAKETGARFVHPGYGFLSENAAFAERLEAEGLSFVGPPAAAIEAMGDKIRSKQIARDAGVNIIPGEGEVAGPAEAAEKAREIGFPVMIKASAGGGGKGMRVAYTDEELAEVFELARGEAVSSFGDGRMMIEKFVEEPRHIEIQVLCDKHGNAYFLPERECSIQRRNQKVIEEAPSPFIDDVTRWAMGAQALALCRQVGYESAGTVEFLVDKHRNFYFLEMNTRLQVEHPITEQITGLDLVEAMLKVAAGERIEWDQEELLRIRGWAIESRIYAEDPARDFMPAVGRLTAYREPPGELLGCGVRVDAGVAEGDEIGVYYDPMISKLVTHAASREEAIAGMQEALDRFLIQGVTNNIPFLRTLAGHPAFLAGQVTTSFIPDHFPNGVQPAPDAKHVQQAMATAAALAWRRAAARHADPARLRGGLAFVLEILGEAIPVRITPLAPLGADDEPRAGAPLEVSAGDGRAFYIAAATPEGQAYTPALLQVEIDGEETVVAQVQGTSARSYRVLVRGVELDVKVSTAEEAAVEHILPEAAADSIGPRALRSPMPGALISVKVGPGQSVAAGDELAVVEAMKMRNVLRAEQDCVVTAVLAEPGTVLACDEVILEFA